MDSSTKKMVTAVLVIICLVVAGYIAYKVYNAAVADATSRIREGVKEGVGEGIGGAVNPMKLFGRG